MTGSDSQTQLWNGSSGDRWVLHREETDRAFGSFGVRAMQELNPQQAERILDVGCGAGSSLLEIAEAVGSSGHVLGLDVCTRLTDCAEERTTHLPHVELRCADAATSELTATYDALFSRFGLMFFASPLSALSHLRKALRRGGRVVATVWQAAEENAWCSDLMRVVLPLVAQAPSSSAPRTPGTFAMAEKQYVSELFCGAGFLDVCIEDLRGPVPMGAGGVQAAVDFALRVGPAASLTEKQSPQVQHEIRAKLTDFFTPYAVGERVELSGAAWLVTARR